MREGFYGLWYERPATTWTEALPIGNGRLGGMVYGGIQSESITLNEESVWDGGPKDRNNPDAYAKLKPMRDAIFAGRMDEAEALGEGMLGIPMTIDSYQPLCSLDIQYAHTGSFREYRRGIDLNEAVHAVQYRLEGGYVQYGHWYYRDSFVSAVDDQMVVRWRTNNERGISADLSFHRFTSVRITAQENQLALEGRCREGGVGFAAMLRATVDKGEVYCEANVLKIRNAKTVVLRMTGFTDFGGDDPINKCAAIMDASENIGYEQLYTRHVEEYRSLYGRQYFTLSGDVPAKPIEAILEAYRNGERTPMLYELWYNYLRYQLISSSRPGTWPSTLQGIWNESLHAPWNSDFHPNVNMQVNYWPAEGYNLAECVEPLIEWMKMCVPHGEKTAQVHYRARGWVLHHLSDIFGCTTPMDGLWGLWPFGGAWLCRHLYEHFLYNGDTNYLMGTALPMIEGSVLFMLDFLMECPEGIPGAGHLITCPSHSPENRFLTDDGRECWLTYAAAMDTQIIYDLFTIYLDCLNRLGLKNDLAGEVKSARDRLMPPQISEKTGCLMEWVEDYEEQDPGHRHVSHLYALYPGTQITDAKPELTQACEASLERRLSHHYEAQGWSCGWIASLFARLGKGGRSLNILDRIACELTLPNLFVDAHGSAQIGDAQGIAACIQEMLVQSHTDVIELLPALPPEWKSGVMKGIRVRGGHIFDLYWTNGKLVKAEFLAERNDDIKLRTTLQQAINLEEKIKINKTEDGDTILVHAIKGRRYLLV